MILLISILTLCVQDSPAEDIKAIKALVSAGEAETGARRLVEAAEKHAGNLKIHALAARYLSDRNEIIAAGAAKALGRLKLRKGISTLIRALRKDHVREAILESLREATGQEFESRKDWTKWWGRNQRKFSFGVERKTDMSAALKRLPDAKEFQATESKHYVVLSDASPGRVKEFLPQFEELYALMQREYKFKDPGEKMVVYFFKDDEGFRRFSERERGPSRGRLAGFASQEGWLAFFEGRNLNLTHIVFHEGAHQVLSSCFGIKDPNWFHEGMAEYVTATKRGTGVHIKRALQDMIAGGRELPLQRLFDEGIRGRRDAYLQAGTVVRFLREKHGDKVFLAWLAQLGKNLVGTQDTLKLFGYKSVEELEKAWKEHW